MTDYLNGFHYENQTLRFFATAEGYVNVTTGGRQGPDGPSYVFSYIYNYTDHLGNIRVSYTKGTGANLPVILEENHYYPFGLKHKKYGSVDKDLVCVDEDCYEVGIDVVPPQARKTYQYKYNGKEFQDELGLNVYDYGARIYMPDTARWGQIDPLAEQMRRFTPYNYAFNNPVYFIDPDGMAPQDWYKNIFTGNITWKEGTGSKLWYQNLGYSWGSTDVDGNRLQMDGNTQQITYNGEVLYDYNTSPTSSYGGFAFSDGGFNQNPDLIRKGGRDTQWIDAGGTITALVAIASVQLRPFSFFSGKGSNGGKPTIDDKANDVLETASFGADAVKESVDGQTRNTTFTMRAFSYSVELNPYKVDTISVPVNFSGERSIQQIDSLKDRNELLRRGAEDWINNPPIR